MATKQPTEPIVSRTFVCEACHRTFESEVSEEEAQAEYKATFPLAAAHDEQQSVVCDKCWRYFMTHYNPEDVEKQHYDEVEGR